MHFVRSTELPMLSDFSYVTETAQIAQRALRLNEYSLYHGTRHLRTWYLPVHLVVLINSGANNCACMAWYTKNQERC